MLFRRIVLCALLVGSCAGLLLSAAQILALDPIIFEAETFESTEGGEESAHSHDSHDSHGADWAPADGGERTIYTIAADIFAGVAYASILLAVMSQMSAMSLARITTAKGFLWGVAGFTVFYVAPGIGMPAEIPGAMAAPVEARQLWWLIAVLAVGAGLLMLSFGSWKVKTAGLAALALPYLIGVPHHQGAVFNHPDPAAVETLLALQQQFIINSAICNLLFWLALGGLSAWALNRWLQTAYEQALESGEADASPSN